MQKIFSFLLYAGLFLAFSEAQLSRSCLKLEHEAEHCLRNIVEKYVGADPHLVVPRNDEQLDVLCGEAKLALKCAKSFKKCLKLITSQLYGMMLVNTKVMIRRTCEDPIGRAEVLRHLQCFNHETAPAIKQQIYRGHDLAFYIFNITSMSKLIEVGCCSFGYMRGEIKKVTNEICNDHTGPETAEYLDQLIMSHANDALQLFCQSLPTVETCYKEHPVLMAEIVEATKLPVNEELDHQLLIESFLKFADRFTVV